MVQPSHMMPLQHQGHPPFGPRTPQTSMGPRLPFGAPCPDPSRYPKSGPQFCSPGRELDNVRGDTDCRLSGHSPEHRGKHSFRSRDSSRSSWDTRGSPHSGRDSESDQRRGNSPGNWDRRAHRSRERNPDRISSQFRDQSRSGSRSMFHSDRRRDYSRERLRSDYRSRHDNSRSERNDDRRSNNGRNSREMGRGRSDRESSGRDRGRFRDYQRSRPTGRDSDGGSYRSDRTDRERCGASSSTVDDTGSGLSDSGDRRGLEWDRMRRESPERGRDRGRTEDRRRRRSPRRHHSSESQSEDGSQRYSRKRNLSQERDERPSRKRAKRAPSRSPSPDKSLEETQEEAPPAEIEEDIPIWLRCSPADLYFTRNTQTGCMEGTQKMLDLENKFEEDIVKRSVKAMEGQPNYDPPRRPVNVHHHHHHHDEDGHSSDSDCSVSSSSEDEEDVEDSMHWVEELNHKIENPYRLHSELWFNEPGEMNDGPLCRCSLKSQQTGIRHNIYPGEVEVPNCDRNTNNCDKLFHYRVTMSPVTNFLTKSPTIIEYDNHEYIFEGFSLFSHYKLENVPICKVIRFNIEYTILFFEEQVPENFTVRSLDLFSDYLFREILELVDLDWKHPKKDCNRFHIMPRFARTLPEHGKELLSMNVVLSYLCDSSKPLLEETELSQVLKYEKHEWQQLVDEVKGMIVTKPGKKPSSIRIDQLDRQQKDDNVITSPVIVHFGIRPAQLSYAGDPTYQKVWKQFVKYKHLLTSKPKVTYADKQKLIYKEEYLQQIRQKSSMKREVTVELDSQGFIRTGIKSDMCQHAMLLPVLICHLRFHKALDKLEENLDYRFKDRNLLQLALTHTSYRVNFGTNPDHARNSLSNCGIRQPEYGDRKIHYVHTRKRGINILIDIMSRMGHKDETTSEIPHNERLEFLGDAVVEFVSSVHLFFMFPWLEEGGLTTYRAAIVQNQHLAVLAKKFFLQDFMLYAHGPDLCHESDLKHAMANCFEALMGALFIDGGIKLVDRIFGQCLFGDSSLYSVWMDLPKHPLQEEEPNGDRQWVESSPALQKLMKFEESTGIKFNHMRLLARAFTLRNVGYNNLTLGHNQRLEFLGDTVLQLVSSDYLFKHFPDHHEGHLSLLRSSLVNNRTQSIVCDDLDMTNYVIYADARGAKIKMKTKEKADLLEAFVGALFIDQDLEYCQVFCGVCFFPRLKDFILNQDWNDPKSQLQQCCLTLRELDGGDPDIPAYKVIESTGPTNTRTYTVAVYFRGERLATGTGHSIQQAEMSAAMNALNDRRELFPILEHQKRFLAKKYKKKRPRKYSGSLKEIYNKVKDSGPESP
ncbi:ribonuclease 3-like [Liolophura sinensis]|uniref:ribonuclease 3-like n=1 Tax=Liolophura sinensis TaxID=3198878 RepID=UPI0031589279